MWSPSGAASPQGATSAIEVTAGHSPWAFALGIVRPQLRLDGYAPTPWLWGTHVLPVSPGRHRLTCWFRWGVFSQAGESSVELDVPAGALIRAWYKAPNGFVWTPGRWTLEQPVALPAPGAGWHVDPSGRYASRYWDGTAWTAHVSTNGVASVDEWADAGPT